jgi:adenosylhomocysteinase
MPLLAAAAGDTAAVFDGLRIGICLHIEPKTAVLCRLLAEHGAEVTITGSPGTTQDDVAAHLTGSGMRVISRRDDTEREHARNIDAVLSADPHLLLDNGGDLTTAVLARGVPDALRGGTEETTTGAQRLRELPSVPFPVIVINDSPLKLLVENDFGVGQTVVQGLMNATNLMLPGARSTVLGFGPCGQGVARTLARLGARVAVVEPDPYRALAAVLEGYQVGTTERLLPDTRLLLLATGRPDVIAGELLDVLPDGVVVAGVGHVPWELDLTALSARSIDVTSVSAAGHERIAYRLAPDREVTVLHGTRMINLVGASGNPIQAMDLGLTLQLRSLAAVATGAAPTGVHPVPSALDRRVATDLVDVLTGGATRPSDRDRTC